MAKHPSRLKHRLALIGLLTPLVACGGPQHRPDDPTATTHADPVAVANDWARICPSPKTRTTACRMENSPELASMVESWEDSQVLRVFNDGQVFKAVVANGLHDELRQAAILTIAKVEGTWAVNNVEPGQTDLLWPGF